MKNDPRREFYENFSIFSRTVETFSSKKSRVPTTFIFDLFFIAIKPEKT